MLEGFAEKAVLEAMRLRAEEIARECDGRGRVGDALIQPESALAGARVPPEKRVSKVFRVHRQEPVFEAFCRDPRVLQRVEELLGPDLDCFLSQFIFKQPGALGQPWHQDSYYFHFDRRPQVGIWLAITDSVLENGPLWVLPGSHADPIHPVVRDRRPHANLGYVEIVERETSAAVPVLMSAGDLLVFHANLMHKSTDNASDRMRAAMVYHYGEAGTVDQSQEKLGRVLANVDWMPVLRGGRPA